MSLSTLPGRVAFFFLVSTVLVSVLSAAEFPDFSKLPVRTDMPDPLVMLDGSRVTTPADWQTKRKPELKALFQHYMYGDLPPLMPIRAEVRRVDKDCLGGKATMKQISIAFEPANCPTIELVVFLPNHRPAGSAAPVVVGLNFAGNYCVLDDPRIALTKNWLPPEPWVEKNRAADAGRGKEVSKWEVEHLIDRGYALATFYYGDVMTDNPSLKEGVAPFLHKLAQEKGGKSPEYSGIAAWAWGLQRAVDYLVTDKDLDAKRIVVYGHSRNGKAALLAGAFDERIAAIIPHQAGCGGTAPSRCHNPKGETITAINSRFPHWFNAAFKEFNGHEDKLPMDQNCLIALCAPRPVLLTCGTLDQWADPAGQLDALRSADAVYRLLGVEGIDKNAAAVIDKRIGKTLGYFLRESPHVCDKTFWDAMLDFTDATLPAK